MNNCWFIANSINRLKINSLGKRGLRRAIFPCAHSRCMLMSSAGKPPNSVVGRLFITEDPEC